MAYRGSHPDSDFYDKVRTPSRAERAEWKTLPLRPIEALNLLVNGDNLTEDDILGLRAILEGDYHPDQAVDLFSFSDSDE